MKKDIHPNSMTTKVTCSCGNVFDVISNKEELQLEVCNKCHPFYTGQQSKISRKGNVDKFNKRYGFEDTETAK